MKKLMSSAEKDIAPLAIQAHGGILVVPLQHDLYDRTLKQLETDVLTKIQETECYNILMDVSEISLMDSYAYERLVDIIGMIGLMGGRVLIVGMQPGVAASLVTLDVDVDDIDTVINMDEGYKIFSKTLSENEEEDIRLDENIGDDNNQTVEHDDINIDPLQNAKYSE
jgi:rsbT antagonist protein RsbS